jgi:hypothetical protein
MTLIRVATLVALTSCAASITLAQEQAASVTTPPNEAALQKQCADKANHDKLGDKLRPTFMLECVANAKLDILQKSAEQK